MKIGQRSIGKVLRALLVKAHYVALINMPFVYNSFFINLNRYLTGRGKYPYNPALQTPIGTVCPTLYTYHDLLTVNEIFCRHDYGTEKQFKTVLDLGSNIGISALYFLTRNEDSVCYLYEPDKRNIIKLRENLKSYNNRFLLEEKAVGLQSGISSFSIEETGRYGGIGVETAEKIDVDVVAINTVIDKVIKERGIIDILKLDIEGLEVECIKAISPQFLNMIKIIYLEGYPKEALHPDFYYQTQYNSICVLKNKLYYKG